MAVFSSLPREIQQEVLDRLVVDKTSLTTRDRRYLLSPMRVNTFWFNQTKDVLWNNITKLETTRDNLETVDRCQLYISKIRYLTLHTSRIHLDPLSALKKLQSLSIDPSSINLAAPWLTEDYFSQWVTNFPHLLHLCLDWKCPLTFTSNIALAQTHPKLRQCKLLWTQELGDWSDLPPLGFVDLQTLGLDLIMNFDRSNIRELVTKFIKHPTSMSALTLPRERELDPNGPFHDGEPDGPYVVRLIAQAAATR